MTPFTDKGRSFAATTIFDRVRSLEAGLVRTAKRWPDLGETQRRSEAGFCVHLFREFAGRIAFRIDGSGMMLFRVGAGDLFRVEAPDGMIASIAGNRALSDMVEHYGASMQCSSILLRDQADDFLLAVYLRRQILADIGLHACLKDGATLTFTRPTNIDKPSSKISAAVLQWDGSQSAIAWFPGHSLTNRATKAFGGATPTVAGRG